MRLSVADVDVSEFALLLGYRSAQSDIATWRSLLISEAITLVAVRCLPLYLHFHRLRGASVGTVGRFFC